MNRILVITATALLAVTPAIAQEADEHDHKVHENHETHDHASHEHDEHSEDAEAKDDVAAGAPLQMTPEIDAALKAGGEPVVADMLGVVCDFCAEAMNKTFGKRDEVAAVFVDLDTKTLNLVFKPAMTLTDDVIHSLVKKSGYMASAIRRGEAALKGVGDAADAT